MVKTGRLTPVSRSFFAPSFYRYFKRVTGLTAKEYKLRVRPKP